MRSLASIPINGTHCISPWPQADTRLCSHKANTRRTFCLRLTVLFAEEQHLVPRDFSIIPWCRFKNIQLSPSIPNTDRNQKVIPPGKDSNLPTKGTRNQKTLHLAAVSDATIHAKELVYSNLESFSRVLPRYRGRVQGQQKFQPSRPFDRRRCRCHPNLRSNCFFPAPRNKIRMPKISASPSSNTPLLRRETHPKTPLPWACANRSATRIPTFRQ